LSKSISGLGARSLRLPAGGWAYRRTGRIRQGPFSKAGINRRPLVANYGNHSIRDR
jgi:hypothetical protein